MHPSMQRSLAQAAALSPQQLCSVCGRAFPCRPRGSWGLRIRLQEQEQGTRRAAQKLSQQACRHQKFAVGQRAADSRALRHSFLRVQESAAGDWAALARGSPDEDDDELMSSINEVCNKGVRLMLAGDDGPLIDYRDELSEFGQHFSDSGNRAGATFIYVVYKLSEHVLPPEATKLEGVYLEAFRRLYALLEESGWRVGKEGEQPQEELSLEQMGYLGG